MAKKRRAFEGWSSICPRLGSIDVVLLALFLLVFLILKSYGLGPAISDENIYFYDATLMTQGYLPYRDFFFAHPPLHLLPGWLLFATVGFHLTAAKLLGAVAAATSGICVYLIALRAEGRLAAVVAAVLFLFSYDTLRASSHWTGINWAVAWGSAGLLAAFRGRPGLAGILLALGATTGIYLIPQAFMMAALLAMIDWKQPRRFLAAFVVVFAGINAVALAYGGTAFVDGVYRYHLLKTPTPGLDLLGQSWKLLFHNSFLLSAPLYLLPFLVGSLFVTCRRDGTVSGLRRAADPLVEPCLAAAIWTCVICFGYVAFLFLLERVYDYYFALLFPPCAVAGGLFANRLRGDPRDPRRELSLPVIPMLRVPRGPGLTASSYHRKPPNS